MAAFRKAFLFLAPRQAPAPFFRFNRTKLSFDFARRAVSSLSAPVLGLGISMDAEGMIRSETLASRAMDAGAIFAALLTNAKNSVI